MAENWPFLAQKQPKEPQTLSQTVSKFAGFSTLLPRLQNAQRKPAAEIHARQTTHPGDKAYSTEPRPPGPYCFKCTDKTTSSRKVFHGTGPTHFPRKRPEQRKATTPPGNPNMPTGWGPPRASSMSGRVDALYRIAA